MNFDKSYIRKKLDNELIYIFMYETDYDPDFIKLVKAELRRRNISIDDLKERRSKIVEIMPPVRKREISGWLAFFLFVGVGLGALLSVIFAIQDFSIYNYDIGLSYEMAILIAITTEGFLLLGIVILAIYTITSFYNYKPNAVALAKAYVIIIFTTNLISLIIGECEDVKSIRGMIWGAIWFVYLVVSDQVNEIFPIRSRKIYKRDKYLIIGIIGPYAIAMIVIYLYIFYIQS